MKKKKILLIGTFGGEKSSMEGQTVKTHNIFNMFKKRYDGYVMKFDTLSVRKNPLLLFRLFVLVLKCDIAIIIPASASFEKVFPILYYLSKLIKYEIIFLGVGGWQIEFFLGSEHYKPHPNHLIYSRNIKAFLPEIKKVTEELKEKYNFVNCETFPNFRSVDLSENRSYKNSSTLRLVFMARINKNKGYNIIFNFVEKIKDCNLDIIIDFYGPIYDPDRLEFMSLIEKYENITSYKNILQPNEIKETLSKYDLLLFPTRYYTEGVPGTILDAYIAGIPVIATDWKHAREVIIDKVSGIVIPFDNCQDEFDNTILKIYNDNIYLQQLKIGTKQALKPYSEQEAWNVLYKYL